MTKGSERDARRLERTRKTLEKYEAKVALAKEWEGIDKEYCQRLHDQANKLRDNLILKGVFSADWMDS